MPEISPSLPDARCSALQKFLENEEAAESSKNRCQSHRRMTPTIHGTSAHGIDHRHPAIPNGNGRNRPQRGAARLTNPSRHGTIETVVPGSGRKPGTSQYYGVRFRPDLNKWVAEIRVAEWKAVDKKVWLGTFGTEQAAARGVDLARKLLKCNKKHPANLPCEKLAAYSKQIPAHLILTDLTATSMFKSATLFIKHECKEYAASFDDTPADTDSIVDPDSSQFSGQFSGQFNCNQAAASAELRTDTSDVSDCDFIGDHVREMILEMSIDDGLHQVQSGLEVDSYETVATNYCSGNYELGMSTSPTGSCVSTVTLEALQTGWEISNCPDVCCTASSSSAVMPEMMSMMDTTTTTTLADVSAASHQYAHDACIWPELQEPFFLSDSMYRSTWYTPPMNSSYAPMDLDSWFPFPGV